MGPDDETAEIDPQSVEMYNPERDEWVPLRQVSFTPAAPKAVNRLSRAVWRCIPLRASFRPDGTMTRFGLWSLRRTLRKMPRGEFITTTKTEEPT